MLIYVEAGLVNCTCNEIQKAQQANLGRVPVQHGHHNAIAKCNKQADQSGQRLAERVEDHAKDRKRKHAFSSRIENVVLEESYGALNARHE